MLDIVSIFDLLAWLTSIFQVDDYRTTICKGSIGRLPGP